MTSKQQREDGRHRHTMPLPSVAAALAEWQLTRTERLEAALRQARSAVASLNEDALGRHHTIGYPFRDELLAHIDAALAPEGVAK